MLGLLACSLSCDAGLTSSALGQAVDSAECRLQPGSKTKRLGCVVWRTDGATQIRLVARLCRIDKATIYRPSRDRNRWVCCEWCRWRRRRTTADCRSFPASGSTWRHARPGCDYLPPRPAQARSTDCVCRSRSSQTDSPEQTDNLQMALGLSLRPLSHWKVSFELRIWLSQK